MADDEGDGDAVGTGAIGSGFGTDAVVGVASGSGEIKTDSLGVGSGEAGALTSLSGLGVNSSAIVGASRNITNVNANTSSRRSTNETLRVARLEKLKLIVLSIRSINLSMNMVK